MPPMPASALLVSRQPMHSPGRSGSVALRTVVLLTIAAAGFTGSLALMQPARRNPVARRKATRARETMRRHAAPGGFSFVGTLCSGRPLSHHDVGLVATLVG